jgi:quercetin dioxygenase-like cupin family protein
LTAPRATLDLGCKDFDAALSLLRAAGFRLDVIYPADRPHTALLDRDGQSVRLTSQPEAGRPGAPARFEPQFVLTRAGDEAVPGRAGMTYRDLIPSRLGGRYVASHIMIAEGGPVADWVHFHEVDFQMIAVRHGWVRVVYEGQGDPFVIRPGDVVLQPPRIRHRVLESSEGLEVVEVGCPALHETIADHDLALPNGAEADRSFSGQRFMRHVAEGAGWLPFHGGEAQETAMAAATGGLADVRTLRPGTGSEISVPPHDGELVFGFVLDGSGELQCNGAHRIGPADGFAIPPGEAWAMGDMTRDFRLLHVTTRKIA